MDEEIHRHFTESFGAWREEIGCVIAQYMSQISSERRKFVCALMEGATLQYLVDADAFQLNDYFARCKDIVLAQLRTED